MAWNFYGIYIQKIYVSIRISLFLQKSLLPVLPMYRSELEIVVSHGGQYKLPKAHGRNAFKQPLQH